MRIMLTYIGDDSYLQLHMNLLRDESKTIQVEAFHVFKIFVANPSRPPRVQAILFKNKERLVNLLKELTPHRSDDKQFLEVSRHESAGFQRCNVQGRSHAKPVCLGTTLRDKDGEYFGQTREPVILHRTLCTEKNKTHIYIYICKFILYMYTIVVYLYTVQFLYVLV
ncbi:Calcium-binding protein 39 (MO25alpha) (Protein Mo25) [Durusdinium trenchii]|uniref:Calcium-binding protein 39 (MO25alpha) (Protein Mo25) n=1 Tax=Durusdinium trenchii TaxID=1381693 RepID=A0ABP0KW47_9DINO